MIKFVLVLSILISAFLASAEILSIPEDCFAKKIEPCLIKSSNAVKLSNSKREFSLDLEENSIVKVIKFAEPFEIELLQGKLVVRAEKKTAVFKLNAVNFESAQVFAQIAADHKTAVYDVKKFVLTEYEPGLKNGDETVISRSEFLAKIDMIHFLSNFYSNKITFGKFLKSIEKSWQKEFKTQTNDQTMALKRSIASIEKLESENKLREQRKAEQLKKVRELFFYRTFYR